VISKKVIKQKQRKAKNDAFLDQQSRVLIYDTIELKEKEQSNDPFTFPCRCGGIFGLSSQYTDPIPICIPCSDCSFHLQVSV